MEQKYLRMIWHVAEACAEFQKKLQTAISTIALTITASQFYLVMSCEQARPS